MPDFLTDRRARIAAALALDDAILLVGAGDPVSLPEGSDQNYPYRSHAEYYYFAAQECPGAFDAHEGAQHGDDEDDPCQQQHDLDGVEEEELHPAAQS